MNRSITLGTSLCLIACLLYSLMTALIKGQTDILPSLPVVVFIQNLTALIFVLPNVMKARSIATNRMSLHFLRALFSLLICYFLYYSVSYISLVDALMLSNSAPLIVPFIGFIFFSEKINHRLWVPVLVGYIGVALVLHPDSNMLNTGAVLACGSAIALAFTIQCVRKLTSTESTTTITFYFLFFSAIVSGVIAIPFWEPISLTMFAVMVLIGFLYFTSQYLANASMRYASPQLISSLMYSCIVYAAIISFFIWHTFPSTLSLLGMLLIIGGGIACIRVEQNEPASLNYIPNTRAS